MAVPAAGIVGSSALHLSAGGCSFLSCPKEPGERVPARREAQLPVSCGRDHSIMILSSGIKEKKINDLVKLVFLNNHVSSSTSNNTAVLISNHLD